jgi:hypothetical protein
MGVKTCTSWSRSKPRRSASHGGYGLRSLADYLVELAAERVRDEFGLHRSDPSDIRMVRQIVGQAVWVEFHLGIEPINRELPAILGVVFPAAA